MDLAVARSVHACNGCFRSRLRMFTRLSSIQGRGEAGERTAKRIEAMGKPLPQNNENEAPFFTRPLKDAADRYADAHAGVIERHEAKRSRHAQQWAQWRHCND